LLSKALNPATQLIALSATKKTPVELADWLGGKTYSIELATGLS